MSQIKDWVFNQVHTKNLVYNTCWEDPRCDRQLMDFDEQSKIVMITSAGCNALDYLLDNPKEIHCIDVNPRQNALLQLKLATFKQTDHDTLFQLFGNGSHPDFAGLLEKKLSPQLPEYAREYWENNTKFFSTKGLRKTFYHYGTSGTVAWLANKYLRSRRKLHQQIEALFHAETLEEQERIYNRIEPRLMNKLVEFFVNRHLTMCLLGVPESQQQLFMENYRRGALGFIQECLRKVFTRLPIGENYFWRLYLYGSYTEDCRPNYLDPQYFDILRERAEAVQTHTTTISEFLRNYPGTYSHFILLDHQDWLAANNREELEGEWRQILKNSRPGTRILLRSAAHEVDFFPSFVLDRVTFEKEETARTHQEDRVGTYASVYMAIVK